MLCSDIAIDLGSEITQVYVKEEGLMLSEPTLVAIKRMYPEKEFFQHGTEAQKLIGREPKGIEVIRPIKKGAIVEIEEAESIVENAISMVNQDSFLRANPKVLVALSSSASEVEKKAMEDAVYNAGARDVDFVEKGLAAALGAGIDISSTTPSGIIDIGGETTEIAIIASSGVVYSKTFDVGGYDLAKGIEESIQERYQVDIGIENAIMLKKSLVNVLNDSVDESETRIIQGKDIIKKRPVTIEVSQVDVYLGVYDSVKRILDAIDEAFDGLSAESSAALNQKGITLVGGSAKLNGLAELISDYTGVNVNVADEPEKCVIMGAGMILDEKASYFRY